MQGAGAKVPILEVFEGDVEEPAFTVFESGAITQFLLETFGNKDIIWVRLRIALVCHSSCSLHRCLHFTIHLKRLEIHAAGKD